MMTRRQQDERGAAAVEFAVVLPILLLVLLGIVEFGFAFNGQISLTQAVREGVRVAALDTGDPVTTTETAFLGAPAVNITGVTATTCPNDDNRARVVGTAEYNLISGFLPIGDTITLRAEAVMRCGG